MFLICFNNFRDPGHKEVYSLNNESQHEIDYSEMNIYQPEKSGDIPITTWTYDDPACQDTCPFRRGSDHFFERRGRTSAEIVGDVDQGFDRKSLLRGSAGSLPGYGSRKVQPEDYDDDHFEADDGSIDEGY